MTPDMVISLGRSSLEMVIILAGPILIFGLVAGVVVSLIQAITQIHDMTLTFIPKIAATILALALFGSWMLQKLLSFTVNLYQSIPSLVH